MSSDPNSTVYIGSKVELYIQYNGVWEQNDNTWIFKDAESSIMLIDDNVTYLQLIDLLYEECEIDKLKYDLKLEAPYQVKNGQPFKPVEIKKDAHVRLFIQKTLKEAQTLCVTLVKKVGSTPASPQPLSETPVDSVQNCDLIEGYVPQYGDDQHVANLSNDAEYSPQMRDNVVAESCLPNEGLDTSLIWSAPNLSNLDVMTPQQRNSSLSKSNVPSTKFHVLQIFESKIQLKTEVALYAIKNNFEYQVKKSGTDVWYITCKIPNCTWKLRARKLKNSSLFEIVVYHGDHTCSLDDRQKNHRQAAPWIVGHLLKNKYASDGTGYLPNDIKEDMKQQYGIDMSYEKAWRCREKALMYVRGTVEESYSNLPSYLHMLQKKNPGTISDFVVEEGRFQYCFFALGASINGFKYCRPVICVDGTFLNTKYGGYMFCAVALDANNNMFPIAHAIVDSENHNSYYYFMSKLKEAVGDINDLAFVSDRNDSVVHAIEKVFPNAYHGTCYHHIIMDVQDKFNTNHCHHVMYMAAYAFCKSEFHKHFDTLKIMDPAIAMYLEGIGFDKWSRAYFLGNRYNVMTSNYIESFNDKTKDARAFPVTTLVEFIRFTIQSLFAQQQDESVKCNDKLATTMEQDLRGIIEKAMFKRVEPLGENGFLCYDDEGQYHVDLLTRSCDCSMFQITGIPCLHAVGAARKRGVDIYSLCSSFYTVETWRETYKETIYPCGNEKEWDVPDNIRTMQVGVPVQKNPVGRPKKNKPGRPKKRSLPSIGEVLVKPRKCNRCGGSGHNKVSCKR